MEDDGRSFYALLGVSSTATDEEIKRAYRQLATTLHPDKVANTAHHDEAATLFSRIQEAYEVLSDPQKRDIYDVYGKEGLAAGLEIGDCVKSRDELKAEWEAFQAKQKKEVMEASVNYRGVYVFKADATALVRPYSCDVARMPELTSIYMTSGLDVPLESKDWGWLGSEQDVAHLGGLVNVRKNVGGGSFLAGYKRHFADYSSLEVHAVVGLRTLLSAQHSVQLDADSTATLGVSWQPNAGLGMQFMTTRQLSTNVSGEYTWVIGPEEAAGMSLGLTRRTEKLVLVGRVEVGASTGLVARIVRQLSPASTARIGVKLSTAGVELDVGGTRRFSEVATAGCSVAVGLQGITLKLRYNRAGHLFDFPILLSTNPLDWPTLLGAYLLPPLLYFTARDLVVRPLRNKVEARRTRAERGRQAEVIKSALTLARSAADLMAPVARRRLAREHKQAGLVVVLALYGEETAVQEAAKGAPQRLLAAKAAEQAQQAQRGAGQEAGPEQQRAQQAATSNGSGGGGDGGVRGEAQQQAQRAQQAQGEEEMVEEGQAAAEAGSSGGGGGDNATNGGSRSNVQAEAEVEVPPAVADVTVAVQYLVDSSKAVFHRGYPKSGLMGFCDPAPTATKLLLVYYTFQGRPMRATISDSEGAELPGRGRVVEDEDEAQAVVQLASMLGEAASAAAGGVSGGSRPSTAAALGGGEASWRENPSFVARSASGGIE